jgi:hypothetical protein
MAVRKPVVAPPSNIEIGNLFDQELEAQNEDLRRKAALGTFLKLRPNNKVTVEQFINQLKLHKDVWAVAGALGILDFCESLLGSRAGAPRKPEAAAKPSKRTRLSEGQKNALKTAITTALGANRDGLSRNDIAKAIPADSLNSLSIDRNELANKLRQPLAELVTDNKIHTVGEKRLMKYLSGGKRK